MGHVGEGTVDVGALAQVINPIEAPDEVFFIGDGTKDHLFLGEVESTERPGEVDLAFVVLICELLSKNPGKLFDALH